MLQDLLDDNGQPIAAPAGHTGAAADVVLYDDDGKPIAAPAARGFGDKAEGLAKLLDTIVPHDRAQTGPGAAQRIVSWLRNPANRATQGAMAGALTGGEIGAIGGPVTGGIGAILGAGAGAFGGAKLRGDATDDAITEAEKEAGFQAATLGTGAIAKAIAPPMMGGALRIVGPLAKKFGMSAPEDLAIAERIIPGVKGAADKARDVRNASMAAKDAGLDAAENRARAAATQTPPGRGSSLAIAGAQATPAASSQAGWIDTRGMLLDAYNAVAPAASTRAQAGIASSARLPKSLLQFAEAQKQTGFTVSPRELDMLKHEWDDELGTALTQRNYSPGSPLTPDEQALKSMSNAARDALNRVSPNYNAQNARTMTAEGVRQAVKGREAMPGRGLETIGMVMAPSAMHVAGRMLRMPQVMGSGAVALDAAGRAVVGDRTRNLPRIAREAILQLLGGQDEPQ